MRKHLILCIYLCFSLGTGSALGDETDVKKKQPDDRRFRIMQDGKVGYIDISGKVVIPAKLTHGRDFSQGLATVYSGKSNGWYYIDPSGKRAFDGTFEKAEAFSEGLAVVANDNLKFGYIDKKGKMVVMPQYDEAYPFSDGIAAVRLDDPRKVRFIDKTGKILFEVKEPAGYSQDVIKSSEGLIAFSARISAKKGKARKFGFLNHKGNFAIKAKWDFVGDFSQGRALVGLKHKQVWKATKLKGGYVDDLIWTYKVGYIDKKGNVVIKMKYEQGLAFSQGMAAVKPLEKKPSKISGVSKYNGWGYIDKSGKNILSFMFDEAQEFSQELAAVKKGGKWGYIDRKGGMVVQPAFDRANSFSNGLAYVGEKVLENKTLRYGYVSKTGKYVWQQSVKE